ncbi:MAG: anhydro-N-acetylmuramic acid kinase [Rhodobacter sp.]|nr:anhydro-N-acetylmuramic acid kinase [Rhodobacter sp.]
MMIASKAGAPVWALGAMSGTSLDGVDAALVRTDGETILEFGETGYRPYSAAEREVLRAGLGRWPGAPEAVAAAAVVETAHAELLSDFAADIVGFHGQTLAHDPRGRGTHQAGDGALLAEVLGVPVVWDFRSADVALGGEGAPLAPFFHFACAKWIGAEAPMAFLNLGGVANLTWVDPGAPTPETDGALLAFDTGPANAPLDDLMQTRRGERFDRDGGLAAAGQADRTLVAQFLQHGYFLRIPPKSLDRNEFPRLSEMISELSDADAAATLVGIAVASVARGMEHFPAPPDRVLVTGGGRRNPVIMAELGQALDCPVAPVETVGLDGDMLEAQAFAFLAVRVARGLPTTCPGTTGVSAAVGGGRLSRPSAEG